MIEYAIDWNAHVGPTTTCLPVKTPLTSYSFLEEIRVCTRGDSIYLIVRAHNAGNLAFLHTHSEWHVECVFNVLFANLLPCTDISLT